MRKGDQFSEAECDVNANKKSCVERGNGRGDDGHSFHLPKFVIKNHLHVLKMVKEV